MKAWHVLVYNKNITVLVSCWEVLINSNQCSHCVCLKGNLIIISKTRVLNSSFLDFVDSEFRFLMLHLLFLSYSVQNCTKSWRIKTTLKQAKSAKMNLPSFALHYTRYLSSRSMWKITQKPPRRKINYPRVKVS